MSSSEPKPKIVQIAPATPNWNVVHFLPTGGPSARVEVHPVACWALFDDGRVVAMTEAKVGPWLEPATWANAIASPNVDPKEHRDVYQADANKWLAEKHDAQLELFAENDVATGQVTQPAGPSGGSLQKLPTVAPNSTLDPANGTVKDVIKAETLERTRRGSRSTRLLIEINETRRLIRELEELSISEIAEQGRRILTGLESLEASDQDEASAKYTLWQSRVSALVRHHRI